MTSSASCLPAASATFDEMIFERNLLGRLKHLGCEFLHKSFREYLYAEAIVEALKDYGRSHGEPSALRKPYWKDFEESDPRRKFSRELSQMLCPYPLSAEIRADIANLLRWEIGRSSGTPPEAQIGQSLTAATLSQWEQLRWIAGSVVLLLIAGGRCCLRGTGPSNFLSVLWLLCCLLTDVNVLCCV